MDNNSISYFNNFDKHRIEIKVVLCDMAFNMGLPRLSSFKRLISAIERSDYINAIEEIKNSIYYRQVKARADRNIETIKKVVDKYQ